MSTYTVIVMTGAGATPLVSPTDGVTVTGTGLGKVFPPFGGVVVRKKARTPKTIASPRNTAATLNSTRRLRSVRHGGHPPGTLLSCA